MTGPAFCDDIMIDPGSRALEPKEDIKGGRAIGELAESARHRSMKTIVRAELEVDRYRVVEEPLVPPQGKAHWESYRPDLLAYRSEAGVEEMVLVECETHPNMRRFGAKNHSSVWFQPYLFRKAGVRRILAVPQGRLARVDLRIREEWEVWVIGSRSPMAKFGRLGRGESPLIPAIEKRHN